MNSYNDKFYSIKELDNSLSIEDKNKIIDEIARKLSFSKELNIGFEDLKNIENVKFNHLKHVVNSLTRCDVSYEVNNNVSNTFTSKLDVAMDNICFLEAMSIIIKYLGELLPSDKIVTNITFEDILNKENKTYLEANLVEEAFYLLIPVTDLSLNERTIVNKYLEDAEKLSWYRKVLIYDWSKKYNLPESIIDKKFKLMGTYEFNNLIKNFLLGEEKILYKDEEVNEYSKNKLLR